MAGSNFTRARSHAGEAGVSRVSRHLSNWVQVWAPSSCHDGFRLVLGSASRLALKGLYPWV